MRNPDKHIRQAFYTALTAAGLQVYDKAVPKAITPSGSYIVISSQTNIDEALGRGCYNQDCTIVLDLFSIQPLSYVSSEVLDDLLEQVYNAVSRSTIAVPYFALYDLKRDGSARDLSFDTDTNSILRKVQAYRLRVQEVTQVEPLTP